MPMPPETSPSPGADPAAVAAHVRRLAGSAEAPWLHAEVARRMLERLQVVRAEPSTVLDWWATSGSGGDGLRRTYPRARIEPVEPSEALRRRSLQAATAPWWSPSRWRAGPPTAWLESEVPRAGQAQLVWSNMMLHWRADPLPTLSQWSASLATDGFVMFSCFGPDTLRELRALHARMRWAPAGHAFIDMHDLGDALLHAGFADPVMDMERIRLTWPDAEAALAELRGLGTNAAAQRFQGLRTRGWRRALTGAMDASLRGEDGRLGMTFEIVYGHAFKPAPRLKVAAETRIDVQTLRDMARAPRSTSSNRSG